MPWGQWKLTFLNFLKTIGGKNLTPRAGNSLTMWAWRDDGFTKARCRQQRHAPATIKNEMEPPKRAIGRVPVERHLRCWTSSSSRQRSSPRNDIVFVSVVKCQVRPSRPMLSPRASSLRVAASAKRPKRLRVTCRRKVQHLKGCASAHFLKTGSSHSIVPSTSVDTSKRCHESLRSFAETPS